MKKTLIALLISIPSVSMASDKYYIGVEGGWSASQITKEGMFKKSEFNKDVGVGTLKGGHSFGNGIRTELALTQYGNVNISKDDSNVTVKSKTLMGNLYYDYPFTTDISGYVMTGLGIAFNKISSNNNKDQKLSLSQTGLAWQVGGGLSYAMTNNLLGDLGVKYVYRDSIHSLYKRDLASFDTTIGVRYIF